MVKEMLWTLMDGIKDANMLVEYANSCDEIEHRNWFMIHAKKRYDELVGDYDYIKSQINLVQKMHEGDPIAEAFDSHIQHEMECLRHKIM